MAHLIFYKSRKSKTVTGQVDYLLFQDKLETTLDLDIYKKLRNKFF